MGPDSITTETKGRWATPVLWEREKTLVNPTVFKMGDKKGERKCWVNPLKDPDSVGPWNKWSLDDSSFLEIK